MPVKQPAYQTGDLVIGWSKVPKLVVSVVPANSLPDVDHRFNGVGFSTNWVYYLLEQERVTGPFFSSELSSA